MSIKTKDIRIAEYNYSLPDERIARFPLEKRDESKLLLYKNGQIGESNFKNLPDYLPEKSLVIFNNTKVIQARLLFHKNTGAKIEIFCLEPVIPHDYALVFQQTERCSWLCLIGNSKKWKQGLLEKEIKIEGKSINLRAEKKESYGESHLIEFSWNNEGITFAELLDAAGILPIPPYLNRETTDNDLVTYQTIYSKIKGSVAAPTAGLHFTEDVLHKLDEKGCKRAEVTLHVGAGTFKPVKSNTIETHEMHTEFISVNRSVIENISANIGQVIAVGTTSVRTLESLYYIGIILSQNPNAQGDELSVDQWFPYTKSNNLLSPKDSLQHILDYLDRQKTDKLLTSTRIIIAPGYEFKIIRGIITNFHQPQSTLLLLISAFVRGNWKPIYDYALEHDFRFLSYGDSSLLL